MDERKFLEIKKQLDESNEDLRDFLADIDRWRSDVKAKNEKLSKSNTADVELPCIRNSLARKKKKKEKSKTSDLSESKKPAIKSKIRSYDYNSWDKFDVEKALEEIDQEPEETKDASESETDEDWEDERRVRLSDLEKDQGNIRFKEGNFDAAIEHYTTAIRLAPENPLLYANRALALLKSDRFASAEADCSAALAIDPKFVKALYRRAQASKQLDKIDDAISDLKRIIEIEPHNAAAAKDLRTLTTDMDAIITATKVPHTLYTLVDSSTLPLQSMRRVPIVEVGTSFKPKQQRNETVANRAVVPNRNKVAKDASSVPQPATCFGAGDQRPPSISCGTPTHAFPPPTNWFQMERAIRELSGGRRDSGSILSSQAVDYLCSIDSTKYCSVIGQNCDASCLSKFITAISTNTTLSPLSKAERLLSLIKLPRFDVAWMLVDEKERCMIQLLTEELRPCLDSDTLNAITNSFI